MLAWNSKMFLFITILQLKSLEISSTILIYTCLFLTLVCLGVLSVWFCFYIYSPYRLYKDYKYTNCVCIGTEDYIALQVRGTAFHDIHYWTCKTIQIQNYRNSLLKRIFQKFQSPSLQGASQPSISRSDFIIQVIISIYQCLGALGIHSQDGVMSINHQAVSTFPLFFHLFSLQNNL